MTGRAGEISNLLIGIVDEARERLEEDGRKVSLCLNDRDGVYHFVIKRDLFGGSSSLGIIYYPQEDNFHVIGEGGGLNTTQMEEVMARVRRYFK